MSIRARLAPVRHNRNNQMRVEDVGARVRVNGLSLSGEVDMFSGYIFDVEGTLVDSVPQTLSSLQEALEQAGFDV